MNRREFLKLLGLSAAAVTFTGEIASALAPSSSLPGATGKTLATSGWGTSELCVGDVFTIADHYAVNPLTMRATDHLQQFVITAVTESTVEMMPSRDSQRVWPKSQVDRINKLGA